MATTQISFKRALIIDEDESIRLGVTNHLKELNVADVIAVESCDEGWAKITEEKFDVLILSWTAQGLAPLTLFNRIKQREEFHGLPVMVVSGIFKRGNFSVLGEFPLTAHMEKPFSQQVFKARIAELDAEALWHAENLNSLETAIHEAGDSPAAVVAALEKGMANSPNPVPFLLIGARELRLRGHLDEALKVGQAALARDPANIQSQSEVAKNLYLLGRGDEALAVFQDIDIVSMQNLERVCLIAEAELQKDEYDLSIAFFQKALEIDPESVRAKTGKTLAGNFKINSSPEQKDAITLTTASVLNTVAIAFVKSKDFAKAIENYKVALHFLGSNPLASRIYFNLGLGLLRWEKPKEALRYFEQSALLDKGEGNRANYYKRSLEVNLWADHALPAEGDSQEAIPEVAPRPDAPTNDFAPIPEKEEENAVI